MSVLVRKSVARTLFSMAFPMLAGTFAMNAYNLTDTWFVARLGTLPLAAMGFSVPVIMLLYCVARGIGSGATTLVSHAIGRHAHEDAARLVTHGVMLTLAVTAIISCGGYFLIGPIFTRLGADSRTLPLISEYMRTWYAGAVFMTLPMLGHGILISVGDSRAASWSMIIGTVLNVFLDPIMIFGLLGWPAMGIRGAALATVISQAVSTVWIVALLAKKYRLISRAAARTKPWAASVREIGRFAVPSIFSLILMPLAATVITKIISVFGPEAVAATGAAGRIEMFAFMIPMALGISLTPFVSQNFGAGRLDRVREAHKVAVRFALFYGAVVTAVFFAAAPGIARIFTADPAVAFTLVRYIRIVSFGYGMMETHRYCGFFLTGMQKPVSAAVLNAVRILGLLIPLSYLGAGLWGLTGVFGGRLASDFVAGGIGAAWVSRLMAAVASRQPPLAGRAEAAAPEAGTAISAIESLGG